MVDKCQQLLNMLLEMFVCYLKIIRDIHKNFVVCLYFLYCVMDQLIFTFNFAVEDGIHFILNVCNVKFGN